MSAREFDGVRLDMVSAGRPIADLGATKMLIDMLEDNETCPLDTWSWVALFTRP